MALSGNATPPKFGGHTSYRNLPVAADEWIYRGAAIGVNPAGFAKSFVPGDELVGFADHEFRASGTDGGDSQRGDQTEAGQKTVRIIAYADNVRVPVSGATRADIGKYVYATDDNTFAFVGHPDAKVGRMIDLDSTGIVVCEMRSIGQHERDQNGVIVCASDFGQSIAPVYTAIGTGFAHDGFKLTSVGAGITAAAGWSSLDGSHGGAIRALLDNDSEAQNLTCETATFMDVSYGMTFEFAGRCSVLGPTATTDVDFGLITAPGSAITAAIRADIDIATSGIHLAKFHLDGNSADILFGTDNNVVVLGPTDTGVDNSLTENKRFKIVVRPTGAVELWINGVRYLSSTAWSVGTPSTLFAGFVNTEKSTGTDVSATVIDYLRVAGAS